jgi:hypothetical protein
MWINLNSKTAELIGMHIGDGTLYKTTRSLVWELRGGLNEKEYYKHVKELLESVFDNLIFYPKFRTGGKNGCYGIQTSKKQVTSFFILYGFKAGCKTYTVFVPDYIKNASKKIQCSFIRGLFDTDGCLRFEKINKNLNYDYPKIEFTFASESLRNDLYQLLKKLKFRPYIWGKRHYSLCLAGIDNLEKFMIEIAPKNAKHLNKYMFWKKYGHYNIQCRGRIVWPLR